VIFIDALDERRGGRGDRDTVDRMVEKLFNVSDQCAAFVGINGHLVTARPGTGGAVKVPLLHQSCLGTPTRGSQQ
jgi:hypothetical protein